MNYRARKNYVLYVSVAFLTGALIYGLLSLFLFFNDTLGFSIQEKIIHLILSIVAGGYLISSILSGILLFVHFIRTQTKLFKILSIIFFFITFQIIIMVGFVVTLPYFIYNIIQIKNRASITQK